MITNNVGHKLLAAYTPFLGDARVLSSQQQTMSAPQPPPPPPAPASSVATTATAAVATATAGGAGGGAGAAAAATTAEAAGGATTLESLNFDNSSLRELPVDSNTKNTPRQVALTRRKEVPRTPMH